MSNLILSKIIKIDSRKYKVQQFKFKNATDCTLYYNKVVKKYADDVPSEAFSYDLNDWTSNNFINNNKPLNVSRFGDIIQIIESRQIIEGSVLKHDLPELYRYLKR